ncbi:MAG: hypothetical protein U9R08_05330 [Nanoarchaeota archaeon]|nr:hypothetical protein [Nanoarchaeota archaeon]
MKKFSLIIVILIILSISLVVALPPPGPGDSDLTIVDVGVDDSLLLSSDLKPILEAEDVVEPSVEPSVSDANIFVNQDAISLQNTVNDLNTEVQSLQSRISDLESELSVLISESYKESFVNSVLFLFILIVLVLVIFMFFYFKVQIRSKFNSKLQFSGLKHRENVVTSKGVKQDAVLKDIVLKYLNSGMSESSIRKVLKKTGINKEEMESVFLNIK